MKSIFLFLNSKIEKLKSSITTNTNDIETLTSSVSNISNNIDDLNDYLYYKTNDVYENDLFIGDGFVSSSSKKIFFNVVLDKSLKNVDTFEVTSGTANIRGVSGIVEDSVTTPIDLTSDTLSYVFTKVSDKEISIAITKGTAFSSATNNTPLSLTILNFAIKVTKSS